MIAIIDYGVCNLRSVHNAVSFISPKTKSIVTSDPDIVAKADKVIFPGQGAMPDCILHLEKIGLKESVIEVAKKKPFLGICLGLQMLFESSEEGNVKGFGLLPGHVKRFQLNKKERIISDKDKNLVCCRRLFFLDRSLTCPGQALDLRTCLLDDLSLNFTHIGSEPDHISGPKLNC